MSIRVVVFIQDPANLPTPSRSLLQDPSQLLRDQSPRVNFCGPVAPMVVLLSSAVIDLTVLLHDLYRHLKLSLQRLPSQQLPNASYLSQSQPLQLRITVHHPRHLSVLLHHRLRLLPQRLQQLLRSLPPRCCTISPATGLTSSQSMREKSSRSSPRKETVCPLSFVRYVSEQLTYYEQVGGYV